MENSEIIIKSHIESAVNLFESGYNCSQSVFLAFTEDFGLDRETAAKISSSFGGGMGRLREVCGAVTGMFMVLGLKYPATDPSDKQSRTANYAAVQRTAQDFKKAMGSYICAELLTIRRKPQSQGQASASCDATQQGSTGLFSPTPSDRTAAYYSSRPCTRCVATAAEILALEIFR